MKAEILFKIEMLYNRTLYKPLIDLAVKENYNYKTKIYEWCFNISDLKKVLAILGKNIEFNKDDINELIIRCPGFKTQVKRGSTYGTGFVKVTLNDPISPTGFIVTTVRDKKPENMNVPLETVEALWRVMLKYPKNKKILTHTVAENFCKEVGITRFNRKDTGTFDWEKFSGCRMAYLRLYPAIKVLQSDGAVEHKVAASKSGLIRKKDKWEIQKIFVPGEEVITSKDL